MNLEQGILWFVIIIVVSLLSYRWGHEDGVTRGRTEAIDSYEGENDGK